MSYRNLPPSGAQGQAAMAGLAAAAALFDVGRMESCAGGDEKPAPAPAGVKLA
jgi:hypothetical protein